MQLAARPWITAGITIAGTSLAVTPLAPPLPALPDIQSTAVQLTAVDAGIDILGPWAEQFNAASDGATQLTNNFFLAPGVALQQAIVNQAGFLQDVINDPSSIGTVFSQFGDNLQSVLSGLTLIGASQDTVDSVVNHTMDGSGLTGHLILHSFLTTGIGPLLAPVEPIPTIVNLVSSPLSGGLMGAAGPFVSPGVAGLNSIEAIVSALQGGNTSAGLADLLAAPANVFGSIFNGAILNLDPLIPLIEQANLLPLPAGAGIDGLSLAFGGLLTPGAVAAGPYGDASVAAAGGSIFNSLGINLGIPGVGDLDIAGNPVGPIGALEGMSQSIAALLGASTWDGKGPLAAIPPLAGLEALHLDLSGMGTAAVQSFNVDDMLPNVNLGDFANMLPGDLLTSFNVDDFANILPADVLGAFNVGDFATVPQELINSLLSLF